jgi:hypothetical protein
MFHQTVCSYRGLFSFPSGITLLDKLFGAVGSIENVSNGWVKIQIALGKCSSRRADVSHGGRPTPGARMSNYPAYLGCASSGLSSMSRPSRRVLFVLYTIFVKRNDPNETRREERKRDICSHCVVTLSYQANVPRSEVIYTGYYIRMSSVPIVL